MYGFRQNWRLYSQEKRHAQDKDGKFATVKLATETLQVPCGGEIPIIPNSLEAWTKKTQMCTIEHAKQDSDQIEKLSKKLKESREKAKKLAIQNENIMWKNKQLEQDNEIISKQIDQLELSMDKQESEFKQQLQSWS